MSAILLALAAILMWSTSMWTGAKLVEVPYFARLGIPFVVGGLIGLPSVRRWRVPVRAFALGFVGIYGYYLLLFYCLSRVPAVHVTLLNYLWPLAIVLLTPVILPGERLSWRHIGAAALGYLGTVAISLCASDAGTSRVGHWPAYAAGAAAAVLWAVYSLLLKRLPPTPSAAVHGVCLACGLVSLTIHAVSGGGIPALSTGMWVLLVVVGIFPMGLAYVCWDAAMKHGDPKLNALLSYLTPPLSMLWLVLLPAV